MPAVLRHPGVYIEEIPSGVRPIAGVSTSDTAFVDFFGRGPFRQPVRVTSFEEFARVFGGFDAESAASFQIAQYFTNGGGVAWVVRTAGGAPAPAKLALKDGTKEVLEVSAANPGEWGRRLRVTVDQDTEPTGLFNLRVREYAAETGPGSDVVVADETHRNLSMAPGSRNAVDRIAGGSALISAKRLPDATDASRPDVLAAEAKLTGGSKGTAPAAADLKAGYTALDQIAPAVFNLLCLPGALGLGDGYKAVVDDAVTYCEKRRAFVVVDVPEDQDTTAELTTWLKTKAPGPSKNAAMYFPRLAIPDPLAPGVERNIPASGTVAGVIARTDASRGVWKAPAGTDAVIRGARLAVELDDDRNGDLNVLGVNVLRSFPIFGSIVWGARTTEGSDARASEWKYIPVRRMALYIEESLYQGLKWVVFEPNDVPLWSQIRLNVGSFLNGLFRQGAFAGVTPREAYFVKCDKDTTTQADVDRGIVNILVGFAPLKPAEFVVLKIQQMAGQGEA